MAEEKITIKSEITENVKKYKKAVLRAGINASEVLIFGSQAKGTQRRDSDIDVAVVLDDIDRDRHDLRIELMSLRNGISNLIEPHPFTKDDLEDPWSTIAYEVRHYGVPVE